MAPARSRAPWRRAGYRTLALVVFALMVSAAFVMLTLPRRRGRHGVGGGAAVQPRLRRRWPARRLAAGLVGAGGALSPRAALLVVVGVPIPRDHRQLARITASRPRRRRRKFVTGQIPLGPALVVALGAVPGAQLGALASRRLSDGTLKRILFIVIVLTGVRVWWQ